MAKALIYLALMVGTVNLGTMVTQAAVDVSEAARVRAERICSASNDLLPHSCTVR
jgi:hypothetical protein